jgi:hypothetical protein
MKLRILTRITLASFLFAAIPFAAAYAVIDNGASQGKALTNLQTRGAAEINRRLESLKAALTRINDTVKLSAADKEALTKQIQAEITSLAALNTKLAADADLATARTDVAKIVTDYRVYALVLPKARLMAVADHQTRILEKLVDLAATLEETIAAAKTDGQNPAAAEASLQSMATHIGAARTSLSGINELVALQPADYNANPEVLMTYRQKLRDAQTNIKAARDDAKATIAALKAQK